MLKFYKGLDGKNCCSFSVEELPEIKRLLDKGEIHGVVINSPNFSQEEINLAGTLEKIKILAFHFNENKHLSLDFVKSLPVLEEIVVNGVCPTIDFQNLPSLRKLIADWNTKIFKNIELNKLVELHLWKMKSTSIENLIPFFNVEKLLLNGGTITSLKGIEKLEKLKDLSLINMRNLEDISALSNKELEVLYIDSCKKITSYDSMQNCTNLNTLKIFSSAAFANLNFIKKIPSLASFRFIKTDVIDGNLSCLFNVSDVFFTQKKHFSHSLKDFKSED